MSLFLSLFWPPMLVVSLHILRVIFLPEAYQLDMVAHFSGGASIALVAWNATIELTRRRAMPEIPRWLRWFLCIATAELVGVLWEFWEFYLQSRFMYMGITLEDTLSDLVLDLCGAIVITSILAWIRRNRAR
jgi:hypothetical protein